MLRSGKFHVLWERNETHAHPTSQQSRMQVPREKVHSFKGGGGGGGGAERKTRENPAHNNTEGGILGGSDRRDRRCRFGKMRRPGVACKQKEGGDKCVASIPKKRGKEALSTDDAGKNKILTRQREIGSRAIGGQIPAITRTGRCGESEGAGDEPGVITLSHCHPPLRSSRAGKKERWSSSGGEEPEFWRRRIGKQDSSALRDGIARKGETPPVRGEKGERHGWGAETGGLALILRRRRHILVLGLQKGKSPDRYMTLRWQPRSQGGGEKAATFGPGVKFNRARRGESYASG